VKSRIRVIALTVAGFALVGLVAVILVLWNIDGVLRHLLATSLSRHLGTRVEIGKLEVSQRRRTVHLENLTIHNPPGFGTNPLLRLPEFYIQVSEARSDQHAVHFEEVRLNLAEAAILINAEGRTNLSELSTRAADAGPSRGKPEAEINWDTVEQLFSTNNFGGIDRLSLSLGRITYTDLRPPGITQQIDFRMTNRMATNVISATDLQPLAGEVLLKAAVGLLNESGKQPGGGLKSLIDSLRKH
jgi:uncharacterized protein involved in outer membrane biogenesis